MANKVLGENYRPFPDFDKFDIEGSLPTASDVVMMLDQYIQAMKKFRSDHTDFGDWNLDLSDDTMTIEDADYDDDPDEES